MSFESVYATPTNGGNARQPLSVLDTFKDVLRNRYAKFDGRARRAEYWKFSLGLLLLELALAGIAGVLNPLGPTEALLLALPFIALIVPSLAVSVRRLHDTNKSGLVLLISLVPIVGGLILLILFCIDGDHGPNRYGPSPKYD